jgi:hypothetical protein
VYSKNDGEGNDVRFECWRVFVEGQAVEARMVEREK